MTNWKDKRIEAMNKLIKKNNSSTLNYLDEYDSVCLSKAKTKTEYKLERKGHEEVNTFNVIRNKLCV
jgi:hypothetical protein|tara:strand:+ start:169 stop:369 length:201 start_codon:yes stop_codon:yes gene_type:complete